MNELSFRPATRQGVKPLLAVYGESGSGKTYSALMLARGIAGPKGRIGMIDTESGRGSLYADVIPGGYDVMELTAPFNPSRYVDAITASESAGIDVLVIDSMSHEWEGIGGVLDMAGDNEQRSGKAGLHNWKTPKLEHNKLVLKLLQTRLAVICCIRAKYKSRQTKDGGKTVIVKDEEPSPIQSEEFIFEMTAHAMILGDHTIRLTKCSHPALGDCFPQDGKEPLSIKHGECIAKWAAGGKMSAPQSQAAPSSELEGLKAQIRAVAKERFGGSLKELQQHAWDEAIIDPDGETLSELPADRLRQVLASLGKSAEALL